MNASFRFPQLVATTIYRCLERHSFSAFLGIFHLSYKPINFSSMESFGLAPFSVDSRPRLLSAVANHSPGRPPDFLLCDFLFPPFIDRMPSF